MTNVDDEPNSSEPGDDSRPAPGYFSPQAQADRNGHHPGTTATDESAGAPGFYSAEQQILRNDGNHGFIDDGSDDGNLAERLTPDGRIQDPGPGMAG